MRAKVSRGVELALFGIAVVWIASSAHLAASAAQGLVSGLSGGAFVPLAAGLFLLFLLVVGFQLLDWVATRRGDIGEAFPLPRRGTSFREWSMGAAAGWGVAVLAVLPLVLSGHLHAQVEWSLNAWSNTLLSLATLLALSLAEEVAARGYAFRRLAAALGPGTAAVLTSALFAAALVWGSPPPNLLTAAVNSFLFGLLLAIGVMRTNALWAGWGAHFAFRAAAGVVFGLPVAGRDFLSVVTSDASGPRWISGGAFGLDAALLTSVALLAGIVWLYRATRDYAWNYTQPVLVGAGEVVEVAPPPAHAAMERQAVATPPPLVQILTATPQGRSTGASLSPAAASVFEPSTGEAPPPAPRAPTDFAGR